MFLFLSFLMISVIFTSSVMAAKPTGDTTPPVVTITNPSEGATVSGLVIITFTATDENSIVALEILVDDIVKSTTQSYDWAMPKEVEC